MKTKIVVLVAIFGVFVVSCKQNKEVSLKDYMVNSWQTTYLKLEMETYEKIKFPQKSYDIHGIVGESDDESLAIIEKEVKIVEAQFVEKFDLKLASSDIPENKAKKVKYLSERIELFKNTL